MSTPGAAPRAFLGVEASLTGRRWEGPDAAAERRAAALAQAEGIALPVAAVLARQGVAAGGAAAFLAPRLRDLLPDPRSLRDMERAAGRIATAVSRGEALAIFADYDVDGAAAAALLAGWLAAFGRRATLYVPDRIEEGYGPGPAAMAALARDHALIVCVDCGTAAHDAVAAATAAGAEVVVLDHHTGAETLPAALAVVNPNRQDEDRALAHLCATAVVFLTLVEANRRLRAEGAAVPDLRAALDLVALATVADVVPLVGVNRALVHQGLRVMAARARPGLAALADGAGLARPPDAHALGFLLGPRINAGGRVGAADLGHRLLAATDAGEAAALAARLEALNRERRAIEEAVRAEALAQAEARGLAGSLVWAAGEGWHPGVVGIVAARLREAADRPAVVIALSGGVGRGSGRSVAGVDLGAAVARLAREGLILRGGGHPMAAGLTVAGEAVPAAMARLADLLAAAGAGRGGPRRLRLDGLLLPEAAAPALVLALDAAGPFGAAAPAPRFAVPAQPLAFLRRLGETHLRLAVGAGERREAGAFGAFAGPLGPALEARLGRPVHLAGRLAISRWGGRERAELHLDDAADV
ncbi:MAG: single-stranded-DNA-specific exonuclease RecJ [Rhodobacteraceae bacterium]|nr:single-stranded-DNA-specific exonuclease RecJ [Paracoccaceae bacterium]